MNPKRIVAAVLIASLLAACRHAPPQAPADGVRGACRRDAADALAGKECIDDARAKQLTGATIVRQIQPGQGVTLDYREERVTVETDPRTGRIVRAFCG